jgi:hypothetical protein
VEVQIYRSKQSHELPLQFLRLQYPYVRDDDGDGGGVGQVISSWHPYQAITKMGS